MTQTSMPTAPDLTHRQILTVLYGLMLGMLVAALSQTVVSTALPTIVGELGGQDKLPWVVTATLLTSTASTPLWGKVSDLYGRKPLFQIAIVVFLVGSALSGLSQNITMLIAFRALQGLGGGGLMALSQTIIGDLVAPRERGRYQGYMGSVFAASSVGGPLLGGFLVDGPGWRWCFYVSIPIGLAALIVTNRVLTMPFARRDHEIDYLGAAFLVAGVSAILVVTSLGGREYQWRSPQVLFLGALSVVFLVLTVWQERRAAEPILPPRLFSNRVFNITSLAGFIVGVAMFGAMIFLPQYLQIVKGRSATVSGLLMTPLMLGLMVTSIGSGRVIARTGRYKVFPVAGLAIMTIGIGLLSLLEPGTPQVLVSLYMLVVGVGMGMVMQVLVLAVQNAVEPKDLGVATSAATFFRSMGGALGVAVFGAVLNNRLEHHIGRGFARVLASAPPEARNLLAGGGGDLGSLLGSPSQIRAIGETLAARGMPPAVADRLEVTLIESFNSALQNVFLVAVPVAALAFVVVLFLHEVPLRTSTTASARASEQIGEELAVEFETTVEDHSPDLLHRGDSSTTPPRPTGS